MYQLLSGIYVVANLFAFCARSRYEMIMCRVYLVQNTVIKMRFHQTYGAKGLRIEQKQHFTGGTEFLTTAKNDAY